MVFGLKAVNDYGSFVINSDYKNLQLFKEVLVANGLTEIPLNTQGVPVIAVKNGGGLIKHVQMSGMVCQSVSLYTIGYNQNTSVRVYTYPVNNNHNTYGLSTYTANGELAYSTSIAPMLISSVETLAYDYREYSYENKHPDGWVDIGGIDIGSRSPCPIRAFQSVAVYSGEWLVIGTGICNTGGGSEWYMGGTPNGEHGSAVPVLGLFSRNIRMDVHDDLVVSYYNYYPPTSNTFEQIFFSVYLNIITLND